MRGSIFKAAVIAAAVSLLAVACQRGGDGGEQAQEGEGEQQGGLLQQIQDRGTLNCGVNATVPGFGFDPGSGEIEGFDIDFCRAIAAAVLGDPESIELIPVDAEERFSALRDGSYDVLVRNTTWTSSRDGAEGVAFAHVNFYDGQAMMVNAGDFSSIDDMGGTSVCVTAGTTTELNLADYFRARNLDFEPVVFETNDDLQPEFIAGACEGWTSDASQLAAIRSQWPEEEGGPESLEILPDVMSKEPLAPAVLDGDQEWFDVVNWVVNGLILAEELGVTQDNVDQLASDPADPGVAALVGVTFEAEDETLSVDHGLGVDNDFMQNAIRAVGNYGEIFDRHVGEGSDLGLERGINALWTDGGIQYAYPFR
jgi:general L-amino acid transport system substrate-binding protein